MISTTACAAIVLPPVSLRLRVREPSNERSVKKSANNDRNVDNSYSMKDNSQDDKTKASPSFLHPSHHHQVLWASLKPPFPPSMTKKRRSKTTYPSVLPRSLHMSESKESSVTKVLTNPTSNTLNKRITIDIEALTYYPAVESTFDPNHNNIEVEIDGRTSEHISNIEHNNNLDNNIVRNTSRKRLRRLSELPAHDNDENINSEDDSIHPGQTKIDPCVAIPVEIRSNMEINRDRRQQFDSNTYDTVTKSINGIDYNQNESPSRNVAVNDTHDVQSNRRIPYKKRSTFGILQAQNVLTTSISSQQNA